MRYALRVTRDARQTFTYDDSKRFRVLHCFSVAAKAQAKLTKYLGKNKEVIE